jgi:hypothetical protein
MDQPPGRVNVRIFSGSIIGTSGKNFPNFPFFGLKSTIRGPIASVRRMLPATESREREHRRTLSKKFD